MRYLRVYLITALVAFSYLKLHLLGRLLGPKWLEKRLKKAHGRNARRVERAILTLKGLFIKVGQLFSIMTNFLPDEFRCELEGLQDQVPPHPYEEIERCLVDELGKMPEDVFAEFDRVPIASASLGQVHRARLCTGDDVAVKVQYADIDQMVRRDLKILKRVVAVISYFMPEHKLDIIYRDIARMVQAELDFLKEGHNLERIGENLKGDDKVILPSVYWEYSTSKVLTLQFIEGIKISDLEGMDQAGICRREVAELVAHIYCKQIFRHGFYHADPHPGNILVRPGPQLVLLDFGAVGRLSDKMRKGIIEFLAAVTTKSPPKMMQALRKIGFMPLHGPQNNLTERIVNFFYEKFQAEFELDELNMASLQIDHSKGMEMLMELRKLEVGVKELSAAFHIPPDWIILERTILLVTGLCTLLDKELKPTEIIQPYLMDFLEEEGSLAQQISVITREVGLSYLSLPGEIQRFLMRAGSGEISLRVEGLERRTRQLYTLGHQIIYTLLLIASSAFALVLHVHKMPVLRDWATGASIFLGLLLILSFIANRPKGRHL